MTNRVVDCGVARPTDADINAIPSITNIGVVHGSTLITPNDNPLGPTNQRAQHFPTTSVTSNGIGVPYNNITGVTST